MIQPKDNSGSTSNKKLILRNFSWIFTGKVFFAISNLIVSIITTRYLGPKNNGIFNYVIAYTTLFSAIATMGMEDILVKEFNISPQKSGTILMSGFVLKFIGAIIACLLSIISAYYIGMKQPEFYYVCIISISFIFQALDVIQYWFQSQSENRNIIICQNTLRLFFILIKLLLAIYNATLLAFIIVTSIETIALSSALLIVYFKSNKKTTKLTFKITFFRKIFKLSWPLLLSGIAINVYMKIDQIMIGNYLGDYELGIYSVAVKLAESWYFIPIGISASVLPILAKTYSENPQKMYSILSIYADGMTFLAYCMSVLVMIFAKPAITILFGKEYIAASNILILYVWSGISVNLGVVRSSFTSITECTTVSLWGTVLGAISNIGINFLLIPLSGSTGAALATIIAQMISAYFSTFLFKKSRKMAIIQTKALFPFIRFLKEIKNIIS